MLSLSRPKASKHGATVNAIFTISIQPELASEAYAYQKPPPFRPGGGFFKFRDVGRLSTENIAKAEELEASMITGHRRSSLDHNSLHKVRFAYD
jgi:hypothetical protein